ncbi:hypothetical protein GCM10027592_31850 [Spirosoma flavus]
MYQFGLWDLVDSSLLSESELIRATFALIYSGTTIGSGSLQTTYYALTILQFIAYSDSLASSNP